MAAKSWIGTSGDWSTAANWSSGSVPGSGDDVSIDTGVNVYTITLGTIGIANSLTVISDVFKLSGTLTLEGILPVGQTIFAGFDNEFDMTGLLELNNPRKESLELNGIGTLAGTIETGTATPELDFDINNTIDVGNLAIEGQIAFAARPGGAVHQTGNILLPSSTDVRFPSIDIIAGGTWEIEGPVSIAPPSGKDAGNFFNEGGVLVKAGNNDTAHIDAVYADGSDVATSQILIDAGTLEFDGTVTDIFRGTIGTTGPVGGGGTLAFGSGVFAAFDPTATLEVSGLVFGGATLATPGFLRYDGNYVQTTGSMVPAGTFELAGVSRFSGGTIDSGTVDISGYAQTFGGMTVDDDGLVLDTGAVDQNGNVTLGSVASGQSGEIDIAPGATWHIDTGGDNINLAGVSPVSEVVNSGLLEMIATGTSTINPDIVDTGTIVIGPGPAQSAAVLDFEGPANVFGGSIGGFGTLVLGLGHSGQSNTLEAGASVGVATFDMLSTTTLEANVTFAGAYIQGNNFGSTLDLNGHDATLLGQATFFANVTGAIAAIAGSGTLTVDSPATAPAVIGNSKGGIVQILGPTQLNNAGVLDQVSGLVVGDDLDNPAFAVNTGTWTVQSATIGGGVSTSSSFTSSGTLAGIGISAITVPEFVSTPSALIAVQNASTLTIHGVTVDIGGSVTVDLDAELILGSGADFSTEFYTVGGAISGPGTVGLVGGNTVFDYTISDSTNITAAGLVFGRNAAITLAGDLAYDGSFSMAGLSSSLNLGGHTFTLNGGSDALPNLLSGSLIAFGTLVTGSGGVVQVNNGPTLGSGIWENAGAVSQLSGLMIGDNLGHAASVVNEVGATYTLVGNAGITVGNAASDEFVNEGTFISGTGTNAVHGKFVNDGTVIDAIEFVGPVVTDVGADGLITISHDGQAQFDNSVDTGQTVQFVDGTGLLISQSPALFNATVLGFQMGDRIEVNNLSASVTGDSFTSGVLSILHGSTVLAGFRFSGDYSASDFMVPTGSNSTVITTDAAPPCYRAGTRIQTPHGGVRVENLAAGDLVQTRFGGTGPIRWVGHRSVDCLRHPDPHLVWPVRILAGAFADDVPSRDLWLSPDHAVFVDAVLIPVKHLINGTTIVQEPVDEVTYYHVELDRHDVLLAEDLPAESYLDTGNRALFANGGDAVVLHPTFEVPKTWSGDAAAPLATDEARVKPVWERLAARSRALGLPIPKVAFISDPAVHLQAGGHAIRPVLTQQDRSVFILPKHIGPIRLMSRSGYPTDSRPWADDWRRLGVYVSRVVWHDKEGRHDLPVDHPSLGEGWWAVERAGNLLRRWTDGDALLPISPEAMMVEVQFAGCIPYRADASEEVYRPARMVARVGGPGRRLESIRNIG